MQNTPFVTNVGQSMQHSTQRFQMNRYISHWFLKWLFWYIINLYWKLHLLVKKNSTIRPISRLQKRSEKCRFCNLFKKSPFFPNESLYFCTEHVRKGIYIFCAVHVRKECVITHIPLQTNRYNKYFAPHSTEETPQNDTTVAWSEMEILVPN